MLYLKTFLISAPILGVGYYMATQGGRHPLTIWPDAFVIGAFMGLFACVAVFQVRHTRRVWGFFPKMIRMAWTHRQKRRARPLP